MENKTKMARSNAALEGTAKITLHEFYAILYKTLFENGIINNSEEFLYYGFVHRGAIRNLLNEFGFYRCG